MGWLQVDEGDDDPSRFWAYVAAALADTVPGLPEAMRSSIGDGLDAAVSSVVNQIAEHGDDVVLVVDDYHLVTNDDVHRSVEQLISLRPANLTIVVSTRVDPPFRLGRLRVRDQLTEVRAEHLRFDDEEATWLLDATATGLRPDAVSLLQERTEGWAAGLVLAGLSLRDGADIDGFVAAFHGDDQLVADYLTDEFLDSVDAAERQRLLDVSILERLSGPLIDEVCDVDDGTEWLAGLAASNQLVISLDRTGTWFRFHHLLRDLLRAELERTSPERSAALHAAAGRWYAEAGDLIPAVEHLLAADRRIEAADIVADNATQLLNIGRTYTVTRYIERLGDMVETHEGLAIVHGWVSFVTGRFAEAERALATATRLDTAGVDAGLILSLSAMIHLAKGDVAAGLERSRTTGADDRADASDGARRRARHGRPLRRGPPVPRTGERDGRESSRLLRRRRRADLRGRRRARGRTRGVRTRSRDLLDRVRRRAPDRRSTADGPRPQRPRPNHERR